MFFRKNRIKQDIPEDLRLKLRELQEKMRKEAQEPQIRYSLSLNTNTVDTAVREIKQTKTKPTFKDILFKYIDSKGLTDPEVYKKAKVDKRTFSKIRTQETKHVSKKTAICFGLALELPMNDFEELLKSNSNSLYESSYFDIAIKWCINNNIYNTDQVNDILFACDLELLTK